MKRLSLPPRLTFVSLTAILYLMLAPSALAQEGKIKLGVALHAGTLGPGISVNANVMEMLNVRASGHIFTYTYTDNFDIEVDDDADLGIFAEADATIGGGSIMVDYFPLKNFLRLTGGVHYNLFKIDGGGRPTTAYEFDDTKTFSPQKLGTLSAIIEYGSPIQPYIGVGIGNAAMGSKRVVFLMDLGMFYTGSPEIKMEGTGLIAPSANYAPSLTEGISSFEWYPYFALGVGFRFF